MEIKTTDEELARFTAMCVAAALLAVGSELSGNELIDMKNALKSDIERNYRDAASAFQDFINESFYTN